jgi:hypothetical protein
VAAKDAISRILQHWHLSVLNQRIENSVRFHYRGQMVEGMILASGLSRFLTSIARVQWCLFSADVHGSAGHEISAEARFCGADGKAREHCLATKE